MFKVPFIVVFVIVAAGASLTAFGYLGNQLARSVVDKSEACQKAHDQWVASGSTQPFTDPCTGLTENPVMSLVVGSFVPLFPKYSP